MVEFSAAGRKRYWNFLHKNRYIWSKVFWKIFIIIIVIIFHIYITRINAKANAIHRKKAL